MESCCQTHLTVLVSCMKWFHLSPCRNKLSTVEVNHSLTFVQNAREVSITEFAIWRATSYTGLTRRCSFGSSCSLSSSRLCDEPLKSICKGGYCYTLIKIILISCYSLMLRWMIRHYCFSIHQSNSILAVQISHFISEKINWCIGPGMHMKCIQDNAWNI